MAGQRRGRIYLNIWGAEKAPHIFLIILFFLVDSV